MTAIAAIGEQFRALSGAEVAAVALAIGYLLLAIRQNVWCWLCAFVSSGLYIVLCVDAKLYMQAALYAFYVLMAVYGWWSWRAGPSSGGLPVTRWSWRVHAAALGGVALLAVLGGGVLSRFTDAAFPYLDSAVTVAALWTTFLVARKVLENWWYWLAINLTSAAIYWNRELELTALLFLVYVAMIPFGLAEWTRSYRAARAGAAS